MDITLREHISFIIQYTNTNIESDNLISKTINYLGQAYFNEWLSGFIEAEGCFSIRKVSNSHSFSIGQKNDKYILDLIKTHFDIKNEVRQLKDNFWFLEVYRKSVLANIINHCTEYPLIGEKALSLSRFKDLLK